MRVSKYVIAAGLILASQPVVAADHILDFSTCMQNFIAYAKQSRPSVASFTVLIGGVCKTEELALVDTPLMGTFLDDPG